MKEKTKILIVEDSPTQLIMLQQFLEDNDFDVKCASNGAHALSLLKNYTPTLIISDVVMPEINGYELCRNIKTDNKLKNISVILLTTLSEPEDIIRGLECGADNFVTKPFNEESLLSTINYILVNRKIRRIHRSDISINVFFGGKKHRVNSDRLQILDMLFSTYEKIVIQKKELEQALKTIQTLKGLIPICSNCKKVRDDKGFWNTVETYIQERSDAKFSHGICPDCIKKLYPDFE